MAFRGPADAGAGLKRARDPHANFPSPQDLEAKAEETPEGQGDSTEGTMIGADEDTAKWAYGGDYYLQEEYMSKLQRHHHGVDTGTMEGGRAAEILVNPNMAHPLFFRLGNDFPPVTPPTQRDGNDDADNMAAAVTFMQNAKADMDIIVPVVSATCALAQSATKGSPSLAELRRTLDRERSHRDVMDTSKSALAHLLTKDSAGRLVEAEVLALQNGKGSLASSSTYGPDFEELTLARQRTLGEEEQDEEERALRRKIRLEQARLGPAPAMSTGKTIKSIQTDVAEDSEEREYSVESVSNELERRRQHRSYERESIDFCEHQLLAHSSGEESYRLHLLDTQRKSLPIYRCRQELMRYIGENAVTIVVGETGSGKTTQLVQYLHAEGYARGGKIIGCTQPRRLAAIGVARRVSDEMHCLLGEKVGYAIHLDDTTTERTEVKFMTDGVLLREIVHDRDVSKYSVIVLDEAHERSVDTDILMGVLKLAVRRRGDLKLIVTSATLNVQAFSRFFGNALCYEIPGRTYDVTLQYSPSLVADYVAEAVFRVCQLHLQMPLEDKHDVLVFMTGRDDVYGTCELIKRRLMDMNPDHLSTLIILPCLSEASNMNIGRDEATGILDETPPGKRKCVVATNVAETSLTIDGVRYVVDCGFMKTNVYRPKIGMNTLQRYPVSQAQANQRKGRAGRTTEGLCFRLYTEEQYNDEMLPGSVPEIQRSSVESVILLLKSIGVTRLMEFDFMDPPPVANTRNSMWHLWILGFLDDDGTITPDGRRALEFPVAPALAKLLIEGTESDCAVEVARVVAVITADPKSLFELPKGKEEVARQCHGRFYANESDHLTLLNVLTQYIDNGRSRQWAQDHFLHAPTLVRACEVLEQLLERLRRLRLPVKSCGPSQLDTVRYCIARAFCMQGAQRSGSNWSEYRPLLNMGVVCHLHPSSAVCARAEMPPYIIYNDLLLMNKEYIVMVTAVEPQWLVEGGRGLYYLRGTRPVAAVSSTPSSTVPTEVTTQPGLARGRAAAPASAVDKGKMLMMGGKRRQNI